MGGLIKMWMVDSIWKIFLACVVNRREGEQIWQHSTQTRRQLGALLQQAKEKPLLTLDNVTPDGYMVYLMVLWHLSHGGRLSKSAYGSKCLAFFHCFICTIGVEFLRSFACSLVTCLEVFIGSYPTHNRTMKVQIKTAWKLAWWVLDLGNNWWCSGSLLFSIFMEPCLLI